jgi:hypothetical protein
MKIAERSSTRLVIDLKPYALLALLLGLGILFLAIGLNMGRLAAWLTGIESVERMVDGSGYWGMNAIAYASAIPFGLALFLAKSRRLTFDRASGILTFSQRGLFGSRADEYPLAKFLSADLRVSNNHESRSAWAVLLFSDKAGEVRVTPYGTGGPGPARLVDTINSWLMETGAAPAFGPGQTITLPGGGVVTIGGEGAGSSSSR